MLEPTPLFGENADFLDALYEQFLRDPASVEERWRNYFTQLAPAAASERAHAPVVAAIVERAQRGRGAAPAGADGAGADARQAAVTRLIQIWINRAHLIANIDPLALTPPVLPPALDPAHYGLTAADLEREFFANTHTAAVPKRMKLRDILAQLRQIYAGPIGAEFAHVSDSVERAWLNNEF